MSELIAKTKEELNQRELEVKAGKWKMAMAKTIAATIWHNFIDNPHKQAWRLFHALGLLHTVCSKKKLLNEEWIYADYFFWGNHIDYKTLDKKVKNKEFAAHSLYFTDPEKMRGLLTRHDEERTKYRKQIEILSSQEQTYHVENQLKYAKHKLASNELNPLCFDADPRAKNKMKYLMDALKLGEFGMDEASKQNIKDAYLLAKSTGKKLVLNFNHSGHTDANLISHFWDWMVQREIIPDEKSLPQSQQKKVRFMCGLYMALSEWVRPYFIGSDTWLVIGATEYKKFVELFAGQPNDVPEWEEDKYIVDGKPCSDKELLRKFEEYVSQMVWADPEWEILVTFPSAGRWPYGGLKESIQSWMKKHLERKDCVYVNIHMRGSEKMRPSSGSAIIGAHNYFEAQPVDVMVGKPYLWWEKTTEETFAEMVEQRDAMQPEWKWVEKVRTVQKKIETVEKTWMDALWQLSQIRSEIDESELERLAAWEIGIDELSDKTKALIEKHNQYADDIYVYTYTTWEYQAELISLLEDGDGLGERSKNIAKNFVS